METPPIDVAVADESRHLLHQRFRQQAARTPDRVALHWQGKAATYWQLDVESDRVASALLARGVGEGAAVGLHLERSIEFVVATLGILKANAAVVPLPPTYPDGRLRDILAFARLDAVIVGDPPMRAGDSSPVLPLAILLADTAVGTRGRPGNSQQAAFVLCSSGSTGQPKMIVRSHRSFFHRLAWTWEHWPYAEGEVCCQKSHMTTTHSIYELFEPLLCGIPIHVVPDEVVRDLESFWELLREAGVTRLLVVPSVLQASLDMPGFSAPPIKVMVLMGEYVQSRLAGRVLAAFQPQTKIFSIYGSTEASSTLVCDLRSSYRAGDELPLGTPISPEVRAEVLGPGLVPVAPGGSGLLYMSGPALFTEYFRNPELTASAFVSDPHGGAVLFNTHDQVRRTTGGAIEFVGRIDHTVKVRGFRVDLGEVEKAILQHPAVGQAAVMLGGPASENPPLVAFYTSPSVERTELYQLLRDRLPAYMIPSVLVGMPSFPLTASGKVDRLRLLEEHRSAAREELADEELSETEQKVAAAWRRVLNRGETGPESNFFEVGGTSLSVFTLIHLLRDAFGLEREQLSEQSVYQYPTVRQLADHIDGIKSGRMPLQAASMAIAVTLKQGDPRLAPLFVIASSGGTLGAYDKLSKALKTSRAIVGIRDPFVWDGRDPVMGFQDWISIYVEAMLKRQPAGPYHVCAFSSAGAFGYEIAQRLRSSGHEMAELVLVDPIGIGGKVEGDFGHKLFAAMFGGRRGKLAVRLEGWWRWVTGAERRSARNAGDNNFAITSEDFLRRSADIRCDKRSMLDLSSLFELNSGLPFTMTGADFEGKAPDQFLATFLARVKEVTPDVDPAVVERILVQYYGLQLPATHRYRLKNYEGKVLICEPAGPHVGLLSAYFRPHVKHLRLRTLELGEPSERVRLACQNLSRSLQAHYRSMRDDVFVAALAAEMESSLR